MTKNKYRMGVNITHIDNKKIHGEVTRWPPLSHYKVKVNRAKDFIYKESSPYRGSKYNGVYQWQLIDPLLKYTWVQ